MQAVAARRLAVAPDPVAGDAQEQRRAAERGQVRGVHDETGPEAHRGAHDRAAEQRDAEEGDEQDVRRPAEYVDRVEDRDLQDRHEEDDCSCLGDVEQVHGSPWLACFGTSTTTDSSDEKSTYGSSCTCL